ncbi:MAG: hypothetical protein AAGA99_00450 [Actinomycetota bacterium]
MFISALLLGAYSAALLSPVWRWYVVPLGVPDPGVAGLWGVGLVVNWLTINTAHDSAVSKSLGLNSPEQLLERMFSRALLLTLSFGMAAGVHAWFVA